MVQAIEQLVLNTNARKQLSKAATNWYNITELKSVHITETNTHNISRFSLPKGAGIFMKKKFYESNPRVYNP